MRECKTENKPLAGYMGDKKINQNKAPSKVLKNIPFCYERRHKCTQQGRADMATLRLCCMEPFN